MKSIIQSQGIHHITLNGANKTTSIEFWQDILGMKLILEQPNLDPSDPLSLFHGGDGISSTERKFLRRKMPRQKLLCRLCSLWKALHSKWNWPLQCDRWSRMAAEKGVSWSTLSYLVSGCISLNNKIFTAAVSTLPSFSHPICSIFSDIQIWAPFCNSCGLRVWTLNYFTTISQVAWVAGAAIRARYYDH